MISFKEFHRERLNEITTGEFAPVTHQRSLSELIFEPSVGGRGATGSSVNNIWLPLSSSMFNRIMPTEVRATVFHVTRMSNFEQLYAIQDSNRSISAFTNMDQRPISQGVQGGSGLVVELDGNILASAREDIMSIPEKSGRRMISFQWFRGPWGVNDVKKLETGFTKMLRGLVEKYSGKFDKKIIGKDDWEKWQHIGNQFRAQSGRWPHETAKDKDAMAAGVIMQTIIKDYFDGVEKVFKQNVKQVQKILTSYMQRRKTDDNWDEIVTNDFKIKKVWIIEDADELMDGDAEEFKSNISFTGLPVEITSAREMEMHVRKLAMKATGRS